MKTFLSLALLSISSAYFSQNKFVEGYIIDNHGEKTNVYIKDLDWLNNPKQFEYKISESDEIVKGNINDIKEFGLRNSFYTRETVDIDKSSENINFLSSEKTTNFKSETLFLKNIVKGKANLYIYKEKNLTRYFYNIDNNLPKQLVYKAYTDDQAIIKYNNEYKEQILTNLNCNISQNEVEKLQYRKNDLEKIFIKYNECSDPTFSNTIKKEPRNRKLFNLTIRPGINQSKYEISSLQNTSINNTFDSNFSFRAGVELEIILPFNNGKWSLIAEPHYSSYKNTMIGESIRISAPSATEERKIKYYGIQLPLGVRHYIYSTDKSKIFANVSFSFPILTKTEINYEFNKDFYSTSSSTKFEAGVGFKYLNKYSAELRFHTKQDLIANEPNYSSNLKTMSLILGYQIF